MRDPNRIPIFCYKLAKLWEDYPDWRFGQLICNLTNREDIFYIEDDELMKKIEDNYFHMTYCTAENDEITNTIKPQQMSLFDIYKNFNIKPKELETHLGESKNE